MLAMWHRRYVEVENILAQGDVTVKQMATLGKEMSQLARITTLTDERNEKLQTIKELRAVEEEERAKGADGEELLQLAEDERMEAEKLLESIEAEIIKIMTPKDEADDRGIIIEVRAGTGNTTLHISTVT